MDNTTAQNIVGKLMMIDLPTGLKQRLIDAAVVLDDESLKKLDEVLANYQSLDTEIQNKFRQVLELSEKKRSEQREKNKKTFLNELDELSKEINSDEIIANS